MTIVHFLQTRNTLLFRAKDPNDELAWDDFASYYSEFIQMLLRKMNVPQNEHADLKQEILIKLWNDMQNFDYDRTKAKFRTWLATVIRNTVVSYMRTHYSQEKRKWHLIENAELLTPDSSNSQQLDSMINKEWAHYMVNQVAEHLRQFFSGKAIDVFLLSSQGKSSQEISRELDVPLNTVYVLRNRVKVRFMQELQTMRNILEF